MKYSIGDHWLDFAQAMRLVERVNCAVPTGPQAELQFVNLLVRRKYHVSFWNIGRQCTSADQDRLRTWVVLQKIFVKRDAVNLLDFKILAGLGAHPVTHAQNLSRDFTKRS